MSPLGIFIVQIENPEFSQVMTYIAANSKFRMEISNTHTPNQTWPTQTFGYHRGMSLIKQKWVPRGPKLAAIASPIWSSTLQSSLFLIHYWFDYQYPVLNGEDLRVQIGQFLSAKPAKPILYSQKWGEKNIRGTGRPFCPFGFELGCQSKRFWIEGASADPSNGHIHLQGHSSHFQKPSILWDRYLVDIIIFIDFFII